MSETILLEPKIDKTLWPPGPWQTEPDIKRWMRNGIHCLIVRVENHGALCGYAAVPPGHPWHQVHYDHLEGLSVHGGLTYASHCHGKVCHIPAPGEPAEV